MVSSKFPTSSEILTAAGWGDLTVDQLDSSFEEDDDDQLYSCLLCSDTFTLPSSLKKHERLRHGNNRHGCFQCKKSFKNIDGLKRHFALHADEDDENRKTKRPRRSSSPQPGPSGLQSGAGGPIRRSRTALNTFQTIKLFPRATILKDLGLFLNNCEKEVSDLIETKARDERGVKFYLNVKIRFVRYITETEKEYTESHFRSKCETCLLDESPVEKVKNSFEKIKASCEEFEGQGSGWVIDEILFLEVNTCIYHPLAASSYIPLPPVIAKKQAIINIKNNDDKCFLWCVLAALHPVEKNPQRVSKYMTFVNEMKLDNISFPTPLSQIRRFEKMNNVSINVFGFDGEVFPLKITAAGKERHINLLLISDGQKRHYTLIKNMNRLLWDLTKFNGEKFYCDFCLHRFSTEERLASHRLDCRNHNIQKIRMPTEEEKWLKFTNYRFQLPVPYTIYADFECILEKIHTCDMDPQISSTQPVAKHIPCGFAYVVVGPDGLAVRPPTVYRGEDAVIEFLKNLIGEEEWILPKIRKVKPMVFTPVDQQNFQAAVNCWVCEKPLQEDRVRDHDHLTGLYRGAAHNNCNLNFQIGTHIPVLMHNLKNYDLHLLMHGIGKFKNRKIQCIPQNTEKFISFSFGSLRFIDSFQFLNTSLEKLVKNLKPEQLRLCNNFFKANAELITRKGCYPYDYFDSFSKFNETSLPPKSAFFNSLTNEAVSDKDYGYAQKIWNIFNLQTLGDFHDLYVTSDVLLLADVFENFRTLCLNYYKIDPCHMFTAPGLAWQACLRMTGVELELLTDIDMHLFIEKGIRGGVAMISHRFASANNPYLPTYDPDTPNSYIMYWDANNLYGWAMSQNLPTHDFSWTEENVDYLNIPDDSDVGYILEVDLEYPSELHHLHNCYPLAPEKVLVSPSEYSDYTKELLYKLNLSKSKPSEKLIPNLRNKEKYVVHYRNLKFYVQLGLKVTKVHRILKFKQSAWLKNYIDFNTDQRKRATSNFEKDLFKLLNNAVFGKTMENLRNRVNIDLVTDEKIAKKLVASPAFHSFIIINNDLVSIQREKNCLFLNRPIYVGFSILDISKILMFDFHYNYIKKKYGNRSKLLFTDTDSLCYIISTVDVYKDISEQLELFDTANYPENHFLFSPTNNKVLGKMKDELSDGIASEFVGLKAKMYSLKTLQFEKQAAKGVHKSVLKSRISHDDYKNCLLDAQRTRNSFKTIISSSHVLNTVQNTKISLCPFDDKRYVLHDGVSTLAVGHCDIKN
ncbi:hypothetical protein AVEN_149573-1 [Araneus ventricosus]|uniref:C2H2-type domain-containing protein n=1 Tax=Araneus ventricosus TaxID=182803 RepID=A0A4Y2QVZ0_ARAVE|nr:hypothetical protein AVEN_149573-1 [Araneus ventricosus]